MSNRATGFTATVKRQVPLSLRPIVGRTYHAAFAYLRHLLYRGSKHYCPYCRRRHRKFLYLGKAIPLLTERKVIGRYGPNLLCPLCGSTDRERLLYYFVEKRIDFAGPLGKFSLLHVAPESNLQQVLRKQPQIDCLSVDLASPRVDQKMDITNMSSRDDWFDGIICCHVLEHIPDDRKAMRELFRVLKPGGWAILQVPISPVLKETHEDCSVIEPADRERVFGQVDHVRMYGTDYPNRLAEAGFNVRKDYFVRTLDARVIEECVLNLEEAIWFCEKRAKP